MDDLKFSVCIPTYKMAKVIEYTLRDVLAQTYTNFEVIISDDNSGDDIEEKVRQFKDERIKFFKNEKRLDCGGNQELCRKRATGDIIYLLSGKTRISKDALMKAYNAFKLSHDIGAVTRPYYWFGKDVFNPVRVKERFALDEDLIVSIHDDIEKIIAVFKTVDNPGGIAYRKEFIDIPFNDAPFVEFTYPFASIFKKHKVVLLKDYTMACPAFLHSHSQDPYVYEMSPIQNWVDMFNTVFPEEEFREMREKCISDFLAVNFLGLVQIRNYATKYRYLLREIFLLVKYRWQNLLNLKFWFFSIGTMITPRFILKPLVKMYKDKMNSGILKLRDKDKSVCLNL